MRFMDLRDPRYAYMFGFIQADGHLHAGSGNKGRLAVEIGVRDVQLLEKFRELCPYPSSVTTRTRRTNFAEEATSAVWNVCALEARRIVNELGVPYGKKSSSVKPPTEEHSAADYVRGLIDADGAVGFTAKGYPFVSFTTQSDALIEYFCDFGFHTTGAIRNPSRNARDNIYNIMYFNDDAAALAKVLYTPDCLALERKREKAAPVIAWERPSHMRARGVQRRWTPEEDEVIRRHPPEQAAVLLGRTLSSCQTRHWRIVGPKKPRVFSPSRKPPA